MSITLPRCDAQDEELRPCVRFLTHDGPHHFAADSHVPDPAWTRRRELAVTLLACVAWAQVCTAPALLAYLALR